MSTDSNLHSEGALIQSLLDVLQGHTKKNIQRALKAVGAVHDIRLVSAFSPQGSPNSLPVSRDTRGQKGPRIRPKRSDPMVLNLRDEIAKINILISKKSRELGRRLEDNDELILQRVKFFRSLQEAKNKFYGLSN
jgi:hypothetical protein